MKISFRLILAALAATAALMACTKQVQPERRSEGKTFTATIESNLTKTTLTDDLAIEWNKDDYININGAVFVAMPGNPATTAVFNYLSGEIPEPEYRAYYPHYLVDNVSGKKILPLTLTYQKGRLNVPMAAASDRENLSFRSICGVLCLSLTGEGTVRSISVSATEFVCGYFDYNAYDDSFDILGGDEQYRTVTLDCGDGVELSAEAECFYIPLPPQVYQPGIEVTITGATGTKVTKTTSATVSVESNTLYSFNWDVNLNEPEVDPINEQFVAGTWFLAKANICPKFQQYFAMAEAGSASEGEQIIFMGLGDGSCLGVNYEPWGFFFLSGAYPGQLNLNTTLIGEDKVKIDFDGTGQGNGAWYYNNCSYNYCLVLFDGKTFSITADDVRNPSYLTLVDVNDSDVYFTVNKDAVYYTTD